MESNGHKRFVVAGATRRITFPEDSPYYGFEAVVRSRASMADILWLGATWTEERLVRLASFELDENELEELQQALNRLGPYLVSWNLDEKDEDGNVHPMPPTADAWAALDVGLQITVFTEWAKVLAESGGYVVDPKSLPPLRNGRRRGPSMSADSPTTTAATARS